jgi:predicted NBD/HSP70 family sugar kinase
MGVKIRTDRLVGVVVDVHGQIVAHTGTPDGLASVEHDLVGTDVETVVSAVAALVGQLATLHSGLEPPVGLGVELSGQVERHRGEVQRSHRMGWHQPVPLAALLQQKTGYRAMVEHDVKALALDEQFFGLGRNRQSFAVVTAGQGIGAGLVIDYKLWRGRSGTAGELGHMVVDPAGRACSCGKRGCLETVAGSDGILWSLQESGVSEASDIRTASQLAQRGDAAARDAFEYAGEALGRGLSWLANLLNLDLVVVRADPALRASGCYEQAVERSFPRHGFYQAAHECELKILDHDHRLGARSAGSMVFRLLSDGRADLGGEEY